MAQNISDNKYNLLSTRVGFNLALGHFKKALSFSGDVEDGLNLADVLTEALEEGEISPQQLRPVLNILLVDKFSYTCLSRNLKKSVESVESIVDVVSQWTQLNLILAFYDSSGNLSVINPANKDHWESLLPLYHNELMICFVKSRKENDKKTELSACDDLFALLGGAKIRTKKAYINPDAVPKKKSEPKNEVKATSANSVAGGSRKLSTKYAVQVTNELFHNGNVEAWKKIIESYKAKHPGLDVLIWYDGERINDINTLFKWGKVKHGTPIMFSVTGDDIKDVSKLRKYLFEGASFRFEVFLKGAVNSVLDLF
ncbi:MAG: hypothetical protein B6241_08045 [Spirochaetaceae bacterium 4572_59]|nr:MAG: hypothetical protein B6241_08045 [Spirochaetaceae bacterium 4572_59]